MVIPMNMNATKLFQSVRVLHGCAAIFTAIILLASSFTAVAAKPWLPPEILSGTASNAEFPRVDVNGRGSLVAAWSQEVGVSYHIQASVNLDKTWTAAATLSPAGQNGMQIDVVIDNADVATVIWTDGSMIQASQMSPGGDWSTPVPLSNTGRSASDPRIVVDQSGNLTAMWVRVDASNTPLLEAADQPSGRDWSAPTQIATGPFSGFSLAMNSAGNTAVIWNAGSFTGNTTIYSSERTFGGGWSAPVAVASSARSQGGAKIGIAANGDLTACWRTDTDIQVADKPFGGTWSGPTILFSSITMAGFPEMTKTPAGDDLVAFTILNGFNYRVGTSVRPAGGSWSAPEPLSSNQESTLDVHVVSTVGGSFLISWVDDNSFRFQSSARTVTTRWAPARPIAGGLLINDSPTDLAAEGNRAVAIWFGAFGQTMASNAPVSP